MTKTASSRPPSRKASRRSKLRRLRSEKTADLRFGPGASAGFSAAGIAAFDDLRPAAVVRELLQNSLDAAHSAGVAKSVVRFRLDSAPLDGIPGIASYRKAFHAAVDRQRDSGSNELPGQARLIAGRIEQALECDHLDILSIMDNGVGLDERRMNALLSDGVSAKDDQSTGSYGNGHFTAVPASDLRYILYGGVTEDGSRVAAGHAVLASHHVDGETHLRGADGFLIRGFNAGTNSLYDYATGQNLPQVIDRDLKCVEAEHGHGTTVIITAFNNFLEESRSLWEMVCQAASANFFIAIEKGRLEVTVEDGRSDRNPMRQTLNRSNLSDIIEKYREQRLSKAFLSGSRAFDAWQAYCLGDRHVITTKAGEIEIHIRENPAGSTRIDLCRNGMWITDDRRSRNSSGIPGFSGKFTDRVPFQAVLSLNAQDGNELHELIRMAEGPLHESISLKRLPSADQKRCRGALNEIRAWILEHTSPIASDPYTPDDFLALDFGDDNGIGGGKSRKAVMITVVP